MVASPPYQLFPDLADEDYQALKRDIAERGILVPVEYDEEGNVLDGHHRLRAFEELGREGISLPPPPSIVRDGMTEREKRQHVRRLNILRRHLTQEQKRDLIRDQVRDTPERSNRQIAGELGVSHVTVGAVRDDLESGGQIDHLDRVTGPDGKNYPRHQSPRRAPNPEMVDDYQEDVDQDPEHLSGLVHVEAPSVSPLPSGYQPTERPKLDFTPIEASTSVLAPRADPRTPTLFPVQDPKAQARADADATGQAIELVLSRNPRAKSRVEGAQFMLKYDEYRKTARELIALDPTTLVLNMDDGDRSSFRRFVLDFRAWTDRVERELSRPMHVLDAGVSDGN